MLIRQKLEEIKSLKSRIESNQQQTVTINKDYAYKTDEITTLREEVSYTNQKVNHIIIYY